MRRKHNVVGIAVGVHPCDLRLAHAGWLFARQEIQQTFYIIGGEGAGKAEIEKAL